MVNSHIKDGIALTKFIFWIKKLRNKKITEIDAQNKLEKFRKQNKTYLFPSFSTIAGTGANGAIVHYKSSQQTNKVINKKDLFLCDSGGQYKYGTTDVTRTICFSEQPSQHRGYSEPKVRDVRRSRGANTRAGWFADPIRVRRRRSAMCGEGGPSG